jgi:hypothetical protein
MSDCSIFNLQISSFELGLQTDSKIFDFICDPIQKIKKIIRSVSEKIHIRISIRKFLTDMDMV